METLTDRQKAIAQVLVNWANDHAHSALDSLLIEEDQVALALGDTSWIRKNTEDLGILCAYCDRKGFPMIPLLVVIPGLRKPEKAIFAHAFKATLSTAENNRLWKEALKEIQKTKKATWAEFAKSIQPEEPVKPKRAKKASVKKPTKPTAKAQQTGPQGESLAEKAFRIDATK